MQDKIESEAKPVKTDEELKQLALDIFQGLVFTDRHLSDVRDIQTVFMPLFFMDEASMERLKADDPGLIYEYISEASPVSANGLPSFFSMKILSQDEAKKVVEMCQQMREAVAKISPEGQPA